MAQLLPTPRHYTTSPIIRRGAIGVLGEEIRPHNATAPRTWLKITERIQFRLCVLAYRCLHGSAPLYLAETLHLTFDIEACRSLRSGSTSTLSVPETRRSSLGDRAFPVAAARAWNTLPVSLRTASSFLSFRRELKTLLFNISFPDN